MQKIFGLLHIGLGSEPPTTSGFKVEYEKFAQPYRLEVAFTLISKRKTEYAGKYQ